MADRATGSYAKDPRVDRAITWLLTTVAIAAIGYLTTTVKSLGDAVGELKTGVAVLRADSKEIVELKTEQISIRERLRALEQSQ